MLVLYCAMRKGKWIMLKFIKRFLLIALAVFLLTFGVNLLLAPHHIAAGGLTGLAIILEKLIGVDRSVVVMVFNFIILIVTFVFLGKEVFLNTVIGATLLPIFLGIVPHYMLIKDLMLSVIFGSVIFGVGVAILFENRASSGGTSIPPLILKKYYNMNTSIGLLITDSIIVTLSMFVFGLESFFYAIFSIIITSATMNYLETGLNRKKMMTIISDKEEEILEAILHEIQKGVTIVPVKGGYSKQEKEMLMVTLGNKDFQQAKDIIDRYDPKAFVIIHNVADVHGLGFTYDVSGI